MAKVIEIYIPNTFRKGVIWIPQRGKVIEFCLVPRGKEVGLSCELLCGPRSTEKWRNSNSSHPK